MCPLQTRRQSTHFRGSSRRSRRRRTGQPRQSLPRSLRPSLCASALQHAQDRVPAVPILHVGPREPPSFPAASPRYVVANIPANNLAHRSPRGGERPPHRLGQCRVSEHRSSRSRRPPVERSRSPLRTARGSGHLGPRPNAANRRTLSGITISKIGNEGNQDKLGFTRPAPASLAR